MILVSTRPPRVPTSKCSIVYFSCRLAGAYSLEVFALMRSTKYPYLCASSYCQYISVRNAHLGLVFDLKPLHVLCLTNWHSRFALRRSPPLLPRASSSAASLSDRASAASIPSILSNNPVAQYVKRRLWMCATAQITTSVYVGLGNNYLVKLTAVGC